MRGILICLEKLAKTDKHKIYAVYVRKNGNQERKIAINVDSRFSGCKKGHMEMQSVC